MSRREQETARRKLKDCGVVEEQYERLTHKMWYRVNWEGLFSSLQARHPPMAESAIPSNRDDIRDDPIDDNRDDQEYGEEISSLHGGRLKITDNGINEGDEWDSIIWIEKGAPLQVGAVVTVPKKKPRRKRAKKKKPVDDKKTYGKLPYEVQEKYKEIFFPKGYDMNVQRQMALGQAKQFVETALKYDFDDPVGLMDLIGKEVRDLMLTKWSPGVRTPTIASLIKRILPLARQTGRG